MNNKNFNSNNQSTRSGYLDLNDHITHLQPYQKAGKLHARAAKSLFECPSCGGKLSVNRLNGEKFTCYGCGDRAAVRRAVLALAGSENDTRDEYWEQKKQEKAAQRAEAERIRTDRLKTSELRHQNWRSILENSFLSDKHRQEMLVRGYTPELLSKCNARSIGGGRVIPILDYLGRMVGGQIIRGKGEGKPWYGASGTNTLKETGEIPLTVIYPDKPKEIVEIDNLTGSNKRTGYIAIVESTGDKPWLCAHRQNMVTIGSSIVGSQPKDLKRTIEGIEAKFGWDEVIYVLMADAGAVLNKQVMTCYRNLAGQIKALDAELLIAWWHQVTKDLGDIDEISVDTPIKHISWEAFEKIANRLRWTQHCSLFNFKGFGEPPKVKTQLKNESTPEQIDRTYTTTAELESILITAIEHEFKAVLDISVTGSGKSTRAAEIQNVAGISKYLYLSQKHRNPTTPEVESRFTDVPSRHNGLFINPDKLTPLGNPYLQTSQPEGETYQRTQGNCHQADLHNKLRSKGYSIDGGENPICMACPLHDACVNSSGIGFGYKFERRNALASAQLRLSPYSAPSSGDGDESEGFDYSEALLIWDDQKIKYSNETTATREDLDRTVAKIAPIAPELLVTLKPLIVKLSGLFDGTERAKFGFSHNQIMDEIEISDCNRTLEQLRDILDPNLAEVIEDADGIDSSGMSTKDKKKWSKTINGANTEFRRQAKRENINTVGEMPSNWLVRTLEVITHKSGYLRFERGRLVVTQIDNYHRSICQAAKLNLFSDATANRQDLALELGIEPNEILIISQPIPKYDNLKIVQVTGMGNPTKDRRESMQGRLDALTLEIKDRHRSVGVIDKIRQQGQGLWYADSRGSNNYQDCDAMALIGAPVPNLGSLAAHFSVLVNRQVAPTDDDPEYRAYINRQIVSETVQGIGRLRAQHRSNTPLTIYWVCEREDLPVAEIVAAYPDCQFSQVDAIDICMAAASPDRQLKVRITEAIMRLHRAGTLTREKLAQLVDCSKSNLTHLFKLLGENFKQGSMVLLKALYSTIDLFKATTDEIPNSLLSDWDSLTESEPVEYVQILLADDRVSLPAKAEAVTQVIELLNPPQLRSLFKGLGAKVTQTVIDLLKLGLIDELEPI